MLGSEYMLSLFLVFCFVLFIFELDPEIILVYIIRVTDVNGDLFLVSVQSNRFY